MPVKKHNSKITPLIFESYLAVVKNSVGSRLFRNFYAKVNGKKRDIMRGGELSCAFHTSLILTLFKFVKGVHATVDSTAKDLRRCGWRQIKKPKIGSVLIWEAKNSGRKGGHKHSGFFIGANTAISNSSRLGHPVRHDWKFGGKRKIEAILWNPRIK